MIFDIVQFYLFCFFLIFPHIACPDLPWPLKNLLRFLYKFRPNQKIHGLRNLPNRNDSFSENTREILPPRVKPRKKKTSHPEKKKKPRPRWVSSMRSWWRTWPFAVLWSWSWSLPWCPIHVLPFGCLSCGWRMVVMRYSSTKGIADNVDTDTVPLIDIEAYMHTWTLTRIDALLACIDIMQLHYMILYVYVYLCMCSRL